MKSSCSSSSSISNTDQYTTIHSAPPKRPSGRTKFKETRHPVYRGVRRRGTAGRWVCEVRNPNNKARIWLGTHSTAEMAARAHDVAMMALKGRSACLNFADSAWLIKLPEYFSSVNDIKKASIEAAENFRPKEEFSSSSSSSSSSCESSVEQVAEDITSMVSDETMNLEVDYNCITGFEIDLEDGFAPQADWFAELDDNQWCSPVSLWS
ncbi:hypothetical protein LUZ60_000222 [Juncus effusus]|nr:hypothetical protein LUZ60_000222 [Juncus effusus]